MRPYGCCTGDTNVCRLAPFRSAASILCGGDCREAAISLPGAFAEDPQQIFLRLLGSSGRALTSVWASAHSNWELVLSTVSPLGHPRLLLISTVRSEPSIPDRSSLAFSPQSVQYMNLIKEIKQLVIPRAPVYCECRQYVNHPVSSCNMPDTSLCKGG